MKALWIGTLATAIALATWLLVGVEHDLPGDHEDVDEYSLFFKTAPTTKVVFVNPFTHGEPRANPEQLSLLERQEFLHYCRQRLGVEHPTLIACFDAYRLPLRKQHSALDIDCPGRH